MQDATTFAPAEEAERRAKAIVRATTHYNDPKVLLEVSEDVPSTMKGLAVAGLADAQMLQTRGW
jgi:pyridoxal 5'-phosphate synthase pdxS subunit